MFEKCLIYTRADGQLEVVHATEEGRGRVQTMQEEFQLITLKRGETVSYIKRFADGTYGLAKFTAPADGIVRLRTRAPEWRLEDDGECLERMRLEHLADGRIPADATGVAIILLSNIPNDRSYRNGWASNGGAIVRHDMAKCKALHRDKLRAWRKSRFEALDALWMRATAMGDTATAVAIEAKRQALRDAPADPRIAAATTIADLKAITLPEEQP